MQNNVIERTLVRKLKHKEYNNNGNPLDFTIGLLDSDIPTNQISYAKVLPDDFDRYIHTGAHLPVVCLNQDEMAIVSDLSALPSLLLDSNAKNINSVSIHMPEFSEIPKRYDFYKWIRKYDSGHPCIMFINNQPVILTVWRTTIAGSSIHTNKKDLNGMMNKLGGGYQLEEIDLSCFDVLPTKE